MSLTALFSRDPEMKRALRGAVEPLGTGAALVASASWEGFLRLVRERPVVTALLDAGAFAQGRPACEDALLALHRRFPHLGLVAVAPWPADPGVLFRLGRGRVAELVLLRVDPLAYALPRALARAGAQGTTSRVLRATAPHLSRREQVALRLALDGVHRRWSADEFAGEVGLSRPFLSECLKLAGLPSAGHLLIWSRLLHASTWLTEPGRTGESVSRQLDYSDGASFRRALRHYTGATPTAVVERGGLDFVLDCFLERCGFEEPRSGSRVSVA